MCTREDGKEEHEPVIDDNPGLEVANAAGLQQKCQRHALAPKRKNAARPPERPGASVAALLAPYTPAVDSASITQSRRVRFGDKVLACLLADAQLPDHVAVAVRVVGLQVIQQATALAYQHQ